MNHATADDLVDTVNRMALENAHLRGEVDRLCVALDATTDERDRARASRNFLVRRLNHAEAAVVDLKDRLTHVPGGVDELRAHISKFFLADDEGRALETDLVQALALLTGKSITLT